MITFPEVINVPLRSHLTGRPYQLVSAAELSLDPATLARIVAICNELEVYQWLFQEKLAGRLYSEKMAREWIEWSKAGWRAKTHFVFVVRDEQKNVAAACDIKSNALNAEIGYWSSRDHRGVMTNAVAAMCHLAADAGFIELFARTKPGNVRSQRVLERVGFERADGRNDGQDSAAEMKGTRKGPTPASTAPAGKYLSYWRPMRRPDRHSSQS